MEVQKVVQRALTDHAFADQLKSAAQKASESGVGSPAWMDYMKMFANNPEELALLQSHFAAGTGQAMRLAKGAGAAAAGGAAAHVGPGAPVGEMLGWRTTLTLTTITSLACTCTTTTTTTTW